MLERWRQHPSFTPVVADLSKEGAYVVPVNGNELPDGSIGWDIAYDNGELEYNLRAVQHPRVLTFGAVLGHLREEPTAAFREDIDRASEDINFVKFTCHDRRLATFREALTDGRGIVALRSEFDVFDQGVKECYRTGLDLVHRHGLHLQ
jgi:hypothetical protein